MARATGWSSPRGSVKMDYMVESPRELVAEFHHHVGARIRSSPGLGGPGDLQRCAFIEEEAQELRDAVSANDLTGVADALADLVYVVYGAALHFGVDLDAAVREVHRSNMTKTPAGDGKAVKGPAYSPPDLKHLTLNG